MALQLKHVFAGEGVRRRKEQGDTLIEGIALFIEEIAVGSVSCGGQFAENILRQRFQSTPGYPYHPYPAATLRGGDGGGSGSGPSLRDSDS